MVFDDASYTMEDATKSQMATLGKCPNYYQTP